MPTPSATGHERNSSWRSMPCTFHNFISRLVSQAPGNTRKSVSSASVPGPIEYLEVAEALPDLPLSDAAFEDGKLSWSLLRALVKVASGETEAEWLGFINSHSTGRAVAEMKDARKKNRKRPRKDSHSLPNLTVKVTFNIYCLSFYPFSLFLQIRSPGTCVK